MELCSNHLSVAKPTQASARGKTQQSVQLSTESEPKAQIISIEKITPGKDTSSVTGDGKKTAEKLAQQLSDEDLELGTQKRTEVTAEHAPKSQPTRYDINVSELSSKTALRPCLCFAG